MIVRPIAAGATTPKPFFETAVAKITLTQCRREDDLDQQRAAVAADDAGVDPVSAEVAEVADVIDHDDVQQRGRQRRADQLSRHVHQPGPTLMCLVTIIANDTAGLMWPPEMLAVA